MFAKIPLNRVTECGRINSVLVVGSARPERAGVPIAGIRDATSDEADFKLVSVLPASVFSGNSNKQGNNPSSNRTLRLTLNSAGRKLACVNAKQGFKVVRLETGCTESCSGIPRAVKESKSQYAKLVLSGCALRGSPAGTYHPAVSSKDVCSVKSGDLVPLRDQQPW